MEGRRAEFGMLSLEGEAGGHKDALGRHLGWEAGVQRVGAVRSH